MSPYIAIAGNIASGKTSLTKMISRSYQIPLFLEDPLLNPFLERFYQDQERWGFLSKMWFLDYRVTVSRAAGHEAKLNIVDGTFWDDLAHARATLSDQELMLYERWFFTVLKNEELPSGIIYLHGTIEELIERSAIRNREFEKTSELEIYLQRLSEAYDVIFSNLDAIPTLHLPLMMTDQLPEELQSFVNKFLYI